MSLQCTMSNVHAVGAEYCAIGGVVSAWCNVHAVGAEYCTIGGVVCACMV